MNKTINKSILKTNYYWEFKPFYDSLPDQLPIPTNYYETTTTKERTTEKEMIQGKKLLTKIEAFGLLAYLCKEEKLSKETYKIGFFTDDNGVPCEFYAYLNSGVEFYLNVRKVDESFEWDAGDGFFLSNGDLETKNQTLSPSETLTLESAENLAIEFCEKWVDGKARAMVELRDMIMKLK